MASVGNWLGSLTCFGIGWLALVSWLPIVGDIFVIALGFYKTNSWLTALILLVGKTLRFLVWNLILGAY